VLAAIGADVQGRRPLFVIDGSKALPTAINAMFGADTAVPRSRAAFINPFSEQLLRCEGRSS
jgi:hypothetical protein